MYSAYGCDCVSCGLVEEILVIVGHLETKIMLEETQRCDLPHQGAIHQSIQCLETLEDKQRDVDILNLDGGSFSVTEVTPHVDRRLEPDGSWNSSFMSEFATALGDLTETKSLKESSRDVKTVSCVGAGDCVFSGSMTARGAGAGVSYGSVCCDVPLWSRSAETRDLSAGGCCAGLMCRG